MTAYITYVISGITCIIALCTFIRTLSKDKDNQIKNSIDDLRLEIKDMRTEMSDFNDLVREHGERIAVLEFAIKRREEQK